MNFPVDNRVRDTVSQLCRGIEKTIATQQQYFFLSKLKARKLLPRHLLDHRFPALFTELEGTNIYGPLSEIKPEVAKNIHRQRNRYERRKRDFLFFILKSEIAHQQIRVKAHDNKIKGLKSKLQSLTTPRQFISICTEINKWSASHTDGVKSTHKKKFNSLKSQKTISNSTCTTPSTRNDNQNLTVCEGVQLDSKCANLLMRGPRFMVAPQKRELKELMDKAKDNLERTICAVRYKEQSENNKVIWDENQNSTNQFRHMNKAPDSLKSVASNFDYLQLQPPKQSSPETENQIKILREEMGSILQDTGTWTWNKNHTKVEMGSLRRTLKDPTTSLILSDKTGRTCALPKSLVQDRTARQLTDGWIELPADPSQSTEKAANKILKKCFVDSDMCDDYVLGRLSSRYSKAPPIYALGKDHKPDFPHTKVRLVQPISGSAIHQLDFLVSKVLTQLVPLLPFRVNSSKVFIEDTIIPIRAQTHPELYQVSMDMVAMYPSLPTDHSAMRVIRQYLNDHHDEIDLLGFNPNSIIEMLQFIFNNSYARVDSDKYYQQTKGVGTGYHSSAAYAEVIVDHTYNTALAALTPADHPISLVTYMDDSHTTWDTRDGHLPLLNELNNVWPSLDFTVETCVNGSISFLDVTIHENRGKLEYELFQKETHSGQYLHWESHCPRGTKLNIVKSETKRIWDLCSQEEKAWKHLEKLRSNFVSSGYPQDQVSMLIADQVAKLKTPGVSRPATNEPEFVLKFPYTNEVALRKAKKAVRKSGMAIRLAPSAGNSLGSLVKRTQCRQTTTMQCNCALHQAGLDVDCKATNVVYDIGCKTCGKHYVGATNRRLTERLNEHEASSRLHTLASTIGFHSREHGEGEGHQKGRPYVRDYDEFVRKYNVKILSRNKDTLGTYISENTHISESENPIMNYMNYNGFVF